MMFLLEMHLMTVDVESAGRARARPFGWQTPENALIRCAAPIRLTTCVATTSGIRPVPLVAKSLRHSQALHCHRKRILLRRRWQNPQLDLATPVDEVDEVRE